MDIQDAASLDAKLERGERLIAVWRDLSATERSSGGNSNNVNTVLNLGGAGLLLGALIGVTGIFAAIDARREARADARVMAAERKADLRELSTIKRDVATLTAYTTLHGQKITKLEAGNGEHPERR